MFSALRLGLFRPVAASLPAGPSRAFSSTPVAQVLKSHSGAKKRFRATGGGSFKHGQAGKGHLNTGFAASRINRLARTAYTNKTQTKTVRRLLPNK